MSPTETPPLAPPRRKLRWQRKLRWHMQGGETSKGKSNKSVQGPSRKRGGEKGRGV